MASQREFRAAATAAEFAALERAAVWFAGPAPSPADKY